MQLLTHLVLVCVCTFSRAEHVGDPLLRRSDGYGRYARDVARDYEPYMFAAIPLHAPVPVLRVLSSMPLTRDRYHAPSAPRPVYARPPYDDYGTSEQDDYEGSYESQYGASNNYGPHYSKTYQSSGQLSVAASNAPEEPTILYARPSPYGGYIYRKQTSKAVLKRVPPPSPEPEPFIIRVHKYKIIRDR